jgi:hypothetical protein
MTDNLACCAKCGETKELCQSVRKNGIKQPRYCKECLIQIMQTGEETYNDEYWMHQIIQFDDMETLQILRSSK